MLLSTAFVPGMIMICVNCYIICWSSEECHEAAVEIITSLGCNMVSIDFTLISILSTSVETLGMLCAEAAKALSPWRWDLKSDDLIIPLSLMWHLKISNLSCIHF